MTKIIAEIGINHNGSIQTCKDLIMLSKLAGCDYCKIQKREPDVCVPEQQKHVLKSTPWGQMTYIDYKNRIEFSEEQIKELVDFSEKIGMIFFASVWDIKSVQVMAKYTKISKIPSALITDLELCKAAREAFDVLIISTGMSSEDEIIQCVNACSPDVIMHTNSTYPCPVEELNLRYMEYLRKQWPGAQIGYSGHEYGLVTTYAAVAMGAEWVERHVTMDREMWGSDQKSSINPDGLIKMVKGVRAIEKAMMYNPGPRKEFKGELEKRKSLRK